MFFCRNTRETVYTRRDLQETFEDVWQIHKKGWQNPISVECRLCQQPLGTITRRDWMKREGFEYYSFTPSLRILQAPLADLLAAHLEASTTPRTCLQYHANGDALRVIVQNPNADLDIIQRFAMLVLSDDPKRGAMDAERLLSNPALPLLMLEDPAFAHNILQIQQKYQLTLGEAA